MTGPVMWPCHGWGSCPHKEGKEEQTPALPWAVPWDLPRGHLPPLWGGLRVCWALLPTSCPVERGPESLTCGTFWHRPPPEATTPLEGCSAVQTGWGPAWHRHRYPPVPSAFMAWLWSCQLICVVLSHLRLQAHLGRLHWHVTFGAWLDSVLGPAPRPHPLSSFSCPLPQRPGVLKATPCGAGAWSGLFRRLHSGSEPLGANSRDRLLGEPGKAVGGHRQV